MALCTVQGGSHWLMTHSRSPTPALDAALERDAERWFLAHQGHHLDRLHYPPLDMVFYECLTCAGDHDGIGVLVRGQA